MQNALLVGLSRQVALERELDVVANNIANINTTGYKAAGAVFEEYLAPGARVGGARGADSRISFVRDRATWVDLAQGPMERTGNPLDVALDGKGYLAVQTPRGERYTRNGALQVNADGQLVTAEGYAVLGDSGPITFQRNDQSISISADGRVSAREGNNTRTESLRGKIRIVGFDKPEQLQKEGASVFLAPDGVVQQPETRSKIVQGSIEKSNVHAVIEMTRMIEVTRSYTQVATLIAQQAELSRTSIAKLSEIPN